MHRNVIEFTRETLKDGFKGAPTKVGLILSFAVYQALHLFNLTIYFYFLPLVSMLMCNFIGNGKTGSNYY